MSKQWNLQKRFVALSELELSVQRGDSLLFHALAVSAVRTGFIAWFAARGRYWPHEKRLHG